MQNNIGSWERKTRHLPCHESKEFSIPLETIHVFSCRTKSWATSETWKPGRKKNSKKKMHCGKNIVVSILLHMHTCQLSQFSRESPSLSLNLSRSCKMPFGLFPGSHYWTFSLTDILTMQRFLDISRYLYSGGWQVCTCTSTLTWQTLVLYDKGQ